MDKEKLIDKIKNLQGLTNDEKADLLGLLRSFKKYGLVWEEKLEEVEERLREEIPVLTEVKERAIISDSADAPNHILIEGDNLEALTTLSYTHEGAIDVIYIDPPYNTGKKNEFKYNDRYVDSEDEYRHSKWLSFMSKRLRIAKRLLSDNGVIIISIDDYSFAQLKLLLDEIFDTSSNPDNTQFISSLIWNKQHSQQQGIFKRYHEYVYVYAKNKKNIKNVLTKGEGIIEAGAMKKISAKNPASSFTFPAGTKFEAKDGTCLQGTYGDSEKVTVEDGILLAKDGKTVYPVTLSAGWTQKKQMESWFAGKETFDTKGQLVLEFYFNSTGKIKCRKSREAVTPCTILPTYGMGSEQTSHLDSILNKKEVFSNPKPVEMIKDFQSWFCNKDGICLDFFAGSGTTLESTMLLNAEDGGNRKCILVTNNENGICENVTYLRNKKVIEGYTTPKGEEVAGLTNNTLRYYRTEFLPRERSPRNMRALVSLATDLLCIKEDLYTEQKMFGKYPTHPKLMRYFADDNKQMLILYKEEAVSYIVEEIKNMEFNGKLKIYIFTPGRYPFSDDFFEVQDKVELVALPAAIYDAYTRVLPKRKEKYLTPEKEEETALQILFNDNEEGEE